MSAGTLEHSSLERQEVAAAGLRGARRRRRARRTGVLAVLLALALSLSGAALVVGDFPLSPGQVLGALLGADDPSARFVVVELRAPRLLLGVLVGDRRDPQHRGRAARRPGSGAVVGAVTARCQQQQARGAAQQGATGVVHR